MSIKLPQAQDDTGTTSEDDVVYLDVLDNDSGGNSISIYSIDQDDPTIETGDGEWILLASGARIMIQGDIIIYDPNGAFEDLDEGETATDTFTYTIQMGNGTIATAEVSVEITGVTDEDPNSPPETQNEVILATVSTDAVIPVDWLLQNDSDPDGDPLTVTAISVVGGLPAGWSLDDSNLAVDGTFTVTTPGATGTSLTLEYTVSDGNGGFSTGTVTVNLAAPSSAGADNIDITGQIYDFSYIEAKEAGDQIAGSTADDTIFAGYDDGSDSILATNSVVGDATTGATPVVFSAHLFEGGDDSITGGDNANNNLFGDVRTIAFISGDTFIGGNDTLKGGDAFLSFFASNSLVGDAETVSGAGSFQGGDDTLIGGDNFTAFFLFNVMIGDVSSGSGANFVGGNDTLISGMHAMDTMVGDFSAAVVGASETGGEDRFVFAAGNGMDTISDFRSTDDDGVGVTAAEIGDKIDFSAMDTLTFAMFDTGGVIGVLDAGDSFVSFSGGSTVIDLGAALGGSAGVDTVTVTGVTGLVEDDFIFA